MQGLTISCACASLLLFILLFSTVKLISKASRDKETCDQTDNLVLAYVTTDYMGFSKYGQAHAVAAAEKSGTVSVLEILPYLVTLWTVLFHNDFKLCVFSAVFSCNTLYFETVSN